MDGPFDLPVNGRTVRSSGELMDKSCDLFRSEKPEHDDVSPRVLYLSHRQPGKRRKASKDK